VCPVVALNTFRKTSPENSAAVAIFNLRDVPSNIQNFVEGYEGHDRQLNLRLA
jgi:hypothetical protein